MIAQLLCIDNTGKFGNQRGNLLRCIIRMGNLAKIPLDKLGKAFMMGTGKLFGLLDYVTVKAE